MAFQFNVRTLLFVVACACIWLAGARIATAVGASLDRGQQTSALVLFCSSMLLAPFWMPTLVMAYALGAGKFTSWTLAAFVAAEFLGFGTMVAAFMSAGYWADC